MKEITLNNRKNGMPVLLLTIALYVLATVGLIFGIEYEYWILAVLCSIWLALGWILFLGLKTLKPQEALVLTLFGNYVGTLKEPGFYFVNIP